MVVRSDGMLVDHSVPELKELHTANYSLFQQNDEILHFTWQFNDDESGIAEYRCVVLQRYEERESKFWPKLQEYHLIVLNATSSTKQDLHLEQMNLMNGAEYRLQVTAINRAELSVKEKSNGITVDVTPPMILKVSNRKMLKVINRKFAVCVYVYTCTHVWSHLLSYIYIHTHSYMYVNV